LRCRSGAWSLVSLPQLDQAIEQTHDFCERPPPLESTLHLGLVPLDLQGTGGDPSQALDRKDHDPIFVPAGETRTVAELGDDWKTRNSHRARAAAALAAAM